MYQTEEIGGGMHVRHGRKLVPPWDTGRCDNRTDNMRLPREHSLIYKFCFLR
jgi:hypothetical protein